MKFSYRALPVLSLFALSFAAQAQKTASVLPKGLYRVRAVGIVASPITQTLNSQGQPQNLMSALERTLTAQDLAKADPQKVGGLYAGFNQVQSGLGDSLISVDLQPNARINAIQAITAIEYGITSRLSLGVIVPTVQMDVKASFNARVSTQNEKLQAIANVADPGLAQGMGQFVANTPTSQTFTDSIFTSNGYQTPRDFRYTGLGDIEIGAKYQYLKAERFLGACLGGVRAPTGTHKADPRNILDRDTGDGQWDLAFECVNEVDALSFLSLGVGGRYTVQLANTQRRALLREGQGAGLPNLNDPSSTQTLRRDLGDIVEGEISARLHRGAWALSGLLSASKKAQDRYSGPAGFQVAELQTNSDSSDRRYEVGLNYSTIPAFAANKFPIPMEVKLAYNSLRSGENVPQSAYARMDLIVYF